MESKLKFRDELKSYVKKVLDVDLDRLPPTRQSKAMTRFYVERVRRIFSPGLVPTEPEDFDACLIDGADDCGVDFISRGDGEVLIIQAKYRGYGVNEKLGDITEFCEVLGRIHPDIGKKYKKNYKLMEAVGDIDWDNDTFQLVFISLGRLGPNLRTKEEEGPTLGPALMDLRDRCELTLCEESDLNVELREAISAGEMITEPVSVTFLPNEEGSPG